jgi:hypothetical protein
VTITAADLGAVRATSVADEHALGAIPEYPLTALPAAAQELVCYGERVGLLPALVAGAALAALGTAIGPESEIEIFPGWRERAILWVALLAPRGAGKSPSQDLAFGPLREHDAQLDEQEDVDAGQEILLGDQTIEALARSLHESQGAGALDLDELSVLLRGLGEYKRGGGGDRGRFLGLWTGAPWSLTRVGSSGKAGNAVKLRIRRPTLVLCGGLQTALHELLGSEEDGLRPRWLPHLAAMPENSGTLCGIKQPQAWQLLLGRDPAGVRGQPRCGYDAAARSPGINDFSNDMVRRSCRATDLDE